MYWLHRKYCNRQNVTRQNRFQRHSQLHNAIEEPSELNHKRFFAVEKQTHAYPFLCFYNNGFFIFLRHQNTGSKRRLDHVYNQIIGQDVQFFHLVTCYICASGNSISEENKQRVIGIEMKKLNQFKLEVVAVCFYNRSFYNLSDLLGKSLSQILYLSAD